MLKLNAGGVLNAILRLHAMSQAIEAADQISLLGTGRASLGTFPATDIEGLRGDIQLVHDELSALGLKFAPLKANQLLSFIDAELRESKERVTFTPVSQADFIRLSDELVSRVKDEFELSATLLLNAKALETYEPSGPLFGVQVHDKFPSLRYEIEEAGKCLGLGRTTAAAFHFIRCMEGGIKAISRCLGILDPLKAADRSWFKLLSAIDTAVKGKWSTGASRLNGDGHFFEHAHATLAAIQNPYRNSTMHLDQKYTEDEARSILHLVKTFMVTIASRMNENGDPKV